MCPWCNGAGGRDNPDLTPETLELAMLEIRGYVVDRLGASSKACAAIDAAAAAIGAAFTAAPRD
ncbi:MAG: hypothetical protein OXG81_13815 [Acidobacteria bacterium]|nr:hypothetical protein [Acidobacteriota bacterium]